MGDNQMSLDFGRQSGATTQMKETYSSGDDLAPKVRKPYTITKQRERWTEDEHKKFLEALKLYGRAWRRIEEHVGTKTAVQIRSHAQKFFSKVVRESTSNSASSVKAIEIPPPRPKRKPVHPYPRKLAHSIKKQTPVQQQQEERSPSPNLSASEQENRSPTSVLSAVGSDTMGSPVSNRQSGSQSPVSSADITKLPCSSPAEAEQENKCLTPTSLPKLEKNGSFSSVADSEMDPQDQSSLELGLGLKESVTNGEGLVLEAKAPTMSLKLFGRTVLVTDSIRPSSPLGSRKSSPAESPAENAVTEEARPSDFLRNSAQINYVRESNESAWSPWTLNNSLMFNYMQALKENASAFEGASVATSPFWAMYGGLPMCFLPSLSMNPAQLHRDSCMEETREYREVQTKEGSWTGSSTASVSDEGIADKNGMVVDSHAEEPFLDEKLGLGCRLTASAKSVFSPRQINSANKCVQGFVPYKRCVAERDAQSSGIVGEEREGQRIRLCL
ncbi:hypothetical protein Scep_016111 [Stephania cephalantha]|uniref:LHY n=1 Tax=Stephania cephalantha TaxID=152367 RepID=A0AAP0ILZ9_9MAGN